MPNFGFLDESFGPPGSNGLVITDFGVNSNDEANYVVINPDGKIIVGGYTNKNGYNDFALACYNPDGSLYISFGPDNNGKVVTNFGGNSSDAATSIAINPNNGNIIVAGITQVNG